MGTGMEAKTARDSGVVVGPEAGTVVRVTADEIVVETDAGNLQRYKLKFQRSNQGTCINQRPSSERGSGWRRESADGPSTDQGNRPWGETSWLPLCPGKVITTRTPS